MCIDAFDIRFQRVVAVGNTEVAGGKAEQDAARGFVHAFRRSANLFGLGAICGNE